VIDAYRHRGDWCNQMHLTKWEVPLRFFFYLSILFYCIIDHSWSDLQRSIPSSIYSLNICSVYLSIYPSIHLIHLYLSIHLSIYQSIYLSIYLSTYLSIYLVCRSIDRSLLSLSLLCLVYIYLSHYRPINQSTKVTYLLYIDLLISALHYQLWYLNCSN